MEINLENREKIIALLKEGTCPICGQRGFMNPLGHISKAHKLPSKELKDKLLLGYIKNTFYSRDSSKKQSRNAVVKNTYKLLGSKFKEHTQLAKKKISLANSKQIIRISKDEIKLYKSITDAAIDNDVSNGAIQACLTGRSNLSAGYYWEFYNPRRTIGEVFEVRPKGKQKNFGAKKPVIRISKTGEEIVFSGVREAARQNGITSSAISACLRGLSKTAGGYRWKYKEGD